MKAIPTMSAVQQWQWWLSLRRGAWGDWGQQPDPEGLRHGTHGAHHWHFCRCDVCSEAERQRTRKHRTRLTEQSRAWKRERMEGDHQSPE